MSSKRIQAMARLIDEIEGIFIRHDERVGGATIALLAIYSKIQEHNRTFKGPKREKLAEDVPQAWPNWKKELFEEISRVHVQNKPNITLYTNKEQKVTFIKAPLKGQLDNPKKDPQ